MAKAEWGAKRACPKCEERFYDLNNDPANCPECGHSFEIASLYQSDIRAVAPRERQDETKKEFDSMEGEELIEDDADIEVDDELLEDDDDNTVSIDEIADVPANEDEE